MKSILILSFVSITALTIQADLYSSKPSDDIWVYEHAGDPSSDPFIRFWGNGTSDFNASYPPPQEFSYSYLKWDLGSVPTGDYVITSATLTITHKKAPGFTKGEAIAAPPLARALGTNFDEKTWNYSNVNNPNPSNPLYSVGDTSAYSVANDWNITFDLLQSSDFGTLFKNVVKGDKKIAIALTTTMNPGNQGGSVYYKAYSKDDDGGRGPILSVTYAPVPEPATLVLLSAGLAGLVIRRRK